MKGLLAVVFICALVSTAFASFARKSLAGPPEEFAAHVVPNPESVKIEERSVTQNVFLQRSGTVFVDTASIPVDGASEFFFSYASPYAKNTVLSLTDPSGNAVDLSKYVVEGSFPIGVGNNVPVQSYLILNSDRGFYSLTITVSNLSEKEIKKIETSPYPHGIITLINNDNVYLESNLNTYVISVGKTVGVSAKMVDADKTLGNKGISVSKATLNVISPNGQDTLVPMNDNGLNGDKNANDGIYGGELQITAPGQYFLQPIFSGSIGSAAAETATEFVRSTQHLIAVSDVQLELTGKATLTPKNSDRVLINIGVNTKTINNDDLRAYAEVWGKNDKSGKTVAVAWIGGLVDVIDNFVTLELDGRWLQRAGVSGSLILRKTYIADVTTSYPIATFFADIPVANSASIPIPNFARLLAKAPVPINSVMRNGVNPIKPNKTTAELKTGLILIPGYCATINPWLNSSADFPGAYFFDEMKLNVPNDEYARKVIAFAQSNGLDSFGLIGHSQGGVVATHIHNFYFSGLEGATGGRLIQSVGTPYQGSTAAANAADLGKVFGIGCGANSDLSRDGAANWLSGISSDARKDVYYFTTTYKRNTFFGDYCSAPMNVILQWPNDGVTELKYAKLEGANDMGNKDKWCHTTDMAYGPQYGDHDRNKEMNTQAAR